MTSELEKLCYPIFNCFCNYWHLSCITNLVEREKFLEDVQILLKEAEAKASKDPILEREFLWIEKPVVFFIDYMVKEGRFPFRDEWWELSRNYSELSGDEKFFDLLNETLENPVLENSVVLFYVMLGLGFDGAFRYNKKYIEQCMRLCMEKADTDFDIYFEPILPPAKKKAFFLKKRRFTIKIALIASGIFMLICFFINLVVFSSITGNYRQILRRTSADSIQHTYTTPTEGGR